ncbi:YceI family protein [Catenulispora subtropica]|uniref:YceI family protein n=1 Tax=Catenulispora subtropica TaxID=450798 RepID=A0ABN2R5K5_9ACTN
MSTDYASLTGDYTFDTAHSTVGFIARHAMVTKVRGGFNEFEGKVHIDGANPEKSSAEASVTVASVDTRNEQRNGHLLSGDFFEQDKYPVMSFKSTGIAAKGDDQFVLHGDLTVKDVTKPVEFDVEFLGTTVDPYGNTRIGFEAKTTVSRKEFGMTWNAALETGGVLVSDKIQIELEISAIKQS